MVPIVHKLSNLLNFVQGWRSRRTRRAGGLKTKAPAASVPGKKRPLAALQLSRGIRALLKMSQISGHTFWTIYFLRAAWRVST